MRIKQTHRKDGGQGWVGLCNDRGVCGVAQPRPSSSYLGSLSKINSQPEDKQSDKPPVEGVKPLLGSCRVLHHDPEQGGQLAVQLVSVVGHLQRLWLCQGWRWRHRPCPPKGHSEAGSGWPSWIQAESPKHIRTMLSLYHTFPMPRFSNQPYGLQMRLVVMQQPVCASSNLQCQNNQLHSLLISQFTSSTFSSELYWMFHILHTSLLTSSLSSGLSLPKPLSGF